MSRKTLIFGSFIAILSVFLSVRTCFSGTLGTPEAEQTRLQDEVSSARNALDALVLKPGMKLDDPRVKAKSADLEMKLKAFHTGFQESLKPPPASKTYPNKTPDRPNGERDEKDDGSFVRRATAVSAPASQSAPPPRAESPSAPDTVLSGDDVKKEISYAKKPKPGKTEKPVLRLHPPVESAEEAVPEATATPDADGLSEIQYPKKKKGN